MDGWKGMDFGQGGNVEVCSMYRIIWSITRWLFATRDIGTPRLTIFSPTWKKRKKKKVIASIRILDFPNARKNTFIKNKY